MTSAFQKEAVSRGLKDKTVSVLVAEDYDSPEALRCLTAEDMAYLKISRAQQGILKKWIEELDAESDGEEEEEEEGPGVAVSARATSGSSVTVSSSTKVSVKTDSVAQAEISLGLSDDAEQEIEVYIKEHGVKDLDKFLKGQLSKYQTTPVNVAITGQSGAGKSSFINCVRNLFGDDDGAAAVGVKETTVDVKPYPDPNNASIVYWDLPGIGTEKFPREGYLETVNFLDYDFFLILSSERFKEDDLYLAKCIHDQGKHFYFLRTKIDADMTNDKRARPRKHDPKELLESVKSDCVDNLRTAELPTQNIFIVSSHLEDKARFDFPVLMETLVKNAPAKKRSSLILSLTACSENGIQEKKLELQKRIPTVARLASLEERVVRSRQDRIVEEVNFYKKQFGLHEDDIEKLGVDKKTLTQRTVDVLGPPGKVLLVVARGLSSCLALPAKLFRNLTGIQKKHESQITLLLQEALDRCEEAALEILRCRRGLVVEGEVSVGSAEGAVPPSASVKVGLGKKGPRVGLKLKR